MQIVQKPLACHPITLFENSALTTEPKVGTFCVNGALSGGGQPTNIVAVTESSFVYQVNLDSVEEFSVQMLPTFNPILLLVFAPNNPRINNGIPFLFACGYDTTTAITPRDLDASTKLLFGQQTWTGLKLPGDFKKFRAYQWSNASPTSDYLLKLDYDVAGTAQLNSRFQTGAFLNFYGR